MENEELKSDGTKDDAKQDAASETSNAPETEKKRSKKWMLLLILIVLAGSAYGVFHFNPALLERLTAYTHDLSRNFGCKIGLSECVEETTGVSKIELPPSPISPDPSVPNQYQALTSRIEQLENAREFYQKPPEDSVLKLQETILQLSSDMQRIRASIPEKTDTSALSEQVRSLNEREGRTERQLKDAEEKILRLEQSRADAATVLYLMGKFDAMEKKVAEMNSEYKSKAAFLVTLIQLKEAVHRGRPFQTELNVSLVLSSSYPEMKSSLRALKPYAERGVYRPSQLRKMFMDAQKKAPSLLDVTKEQVSSSFWQNVLDFFRGLVRIQKIDSVDENAPATHMAQAKQFILDDDFRSALAEIQNLPPEFRAVFSDFEREAAATQDTDARVQSLISQALAVLYAGKLEE